MNRFTMGKIKGFGIIMLLLITAAARADDLLCFDEAGETYNINPNILRAIANVESKYNPRAVNWNRNGSYDFGVMQINSSWGHTYGAEWWSTLGDPCTNIKAGAKILAMCMKKYGYSWEAIGCYNSQTPGKRNNYAIKVFNQLQRFEREDRIKASVSPKTVAPDTSPDSGKEVAEEVLQQDKQEEQNALTQASIRSRDMRTLQHFEQYRLR